MRFLLHLLIFVYCFSVGTVTALGQNIEAGIHGGLASISGHAPDRSETGGEYGVWLGLWPNDSIAVSFDWAYLPLAEFESTLNGSLVGERSRNRQYVDVTLQYHLVRASRVSAFLEAGGGAHWDNRDVFNPSGESGFEEAGKESTRTGVWTLGGGLRTRILPHLNWINEIKLHNLGSREKEGLRFLTGLTFSWR